MTMPNLIKFQGSCHVRFGSLADICAAKRHVRFTPNSDRESGFPQTVMSALPPKADMCSALAPVRFGPKATLMGFAVVDRNYVAFQALLGSCADNYRASERYFGCPC